MTWIEKDRKYIWHPFTQMKTAGPPILIKRASGALIYDEHDNPIIDAVSSWWVNVHGHAHPYIANKIHQQLLTLEHVIFAGFTHPPAIELGERLLSYLPHLSKIFFSDNGSTAVEVGLKMALQYHYNLGREKTTIIAFENAYHGDTFGAMSVGGDDGFNDPFKKLMFDIKRIPTPVPGKESECLSKLDSILEQEDVCCIIFEPLVQGAGGMVMYPPGVLDEIIRKCKEKDVVCIADEVMTGFYRTGKMFAQNHLAETPDITCMSKGLTGGTLPLSLTCCTQKIYDAFLSDDKSKTFFHGHSFTGNPIGCAASLASLDLFEQENTLDNIKRVIESHEKFRKEIEDHPKLENVRQQGTIIAMDFKTSSPTSYFNNIRDRLYDYFMDKNILLRPLGNVVYIMPPYCITDKQLEKVYQAILNALNEID